MRPLALLMLFSAVLVAPAPEALAYALRGSVLGNGGAPMTGGGRRIEGTAGQPVVGASGSATRMLCHGFWCFGGSRVVAVDDPPAPPDLPQRLELGSAFPNPASRQVTFVVALPKAARLSLEVLDVRGRMVRRLETTFEAGFRSMVWDGADEAGRLLDAGLYFTRVAVNGQSVGMRRIVVRR